MRVTIKVCKTNCFDPSRQVLHAQTQSVLFHDRSAAFFASDAGFSLGLCDLMLLKTQTKNVAGEAPCIVSLASTERVGINGMVRCHTSKRADRLGRCTR